MPKADALLRAARRHLAETETPALDARLLLQHATGLTQLDLVTTPDADVTIAQAELFTQLINRRAAHEPVSRILGERSFYGRSFTVSPAVLDPRPDTEVLLEAALARLPPDRPCRILDLGTGSGIIALSILAERRLATGVAVDVSADALAIAAANAKRLGVADRLQLVTSSWFENVRGQFDAILSNPPYIEASAIAGLEEEVRNYDPHLALVGGEDGLDCYRAIACHAASHMAGNGFLAVEIGAGQAGDVAAIFAREKFALEAEFQDLGGHLRCQVFVSTSTKS